MRAQSNTHGVDIGNPGRSGKMLPYTLPTREKAEIAELIIDIQTPKRKSSVHD
jgi:hypothetical protein